jgi:hypothetical protein
MRVAVDLLYSPSPGAVAAWTLGATLAWGVHPRLGRGAPDAPRRPRRQDGQATIEWTAVVLLVSLALGALLSFGLRTDGRSYGGFLAHRLACAVKGTCRDGEEALQRAYGGRGAALVRAHAPNLVYEPGERQLPVDWRRCRRPGCANASGDRDLDVHRSDAGERATVFTRVLRRGGRTYIQYWLYYPDSNTTLAGSDKAWELAWVLPIMRGLIERAPPYPGFHRDDWEAFAVRLDPDGSVWTRASSHGHWQGCKDRDCEGEWTQSTGWTRVSRGSHAGHIPMRTDVRPRRRARGPGADRFPGFVELERRRTPLLPGHDLHERTTTGEGLRLIPLETHDRSRYRPNAEGIRPPWRKEAYTDPESDES